MESKDCTKEFIANLTEIFNCPQAKQLSEITKGEMLALVYLYEHDCTALPSELSDAMRVSTARVAVMLNNLESKSYIIRKKYSDINDQRKITINITSEGRFIVSRKQQEVFNKIEEVLYELGEEDTKTFIRISKRLMEIMSEK
jgi:DNA-binding MarR family transcriptional regulator